ncbi:unnamed protein product [Prorocentrum cordatum]|uniref:Subtilisin n=1 Tax=Prorocentrum cordatum TaxID=2364126 RepID=A0ABN9YA60_9DINO|nr:unnamed protein product [Polarella glacialis]
MGAGRGRWQSPAGTRVASTALAWLALRASPAAGADDDQVMAGVVCKYKKHENKAYMSAVNWIKLQSQEEAAKQCSERELCEGYHQHPFTKMWYLFKEGAELIEEGRVTEGFVAYKSKKKGPTHASASAGGLAGAASWPALGAGAASRSGAHARAGEVAAAPASVEGAALNSRLPLIGCLAGLLLLATLRGAAGGEGQTDGLDLSDTCESCLVKGGGWCTTEQRCVEDDIAHCDAESLIGLAGFTNDCGSDEEGQKPRVRPWIDKGVLVSYPHENGTCCLGIGIVNRGARPTSWRSTPSCCATGLGRR